MARRGLALYRRGQVFSFFAVADSSLLPIGYAESTMQLRADYCSAVYTPPRSSGREPGTAPQRVDLWPPPGLRSGGGRVVRRDPERFRRR
jgi:hypothetical protein